MQGSCCGDKKGGQCCNSTLHCVARSTFAVPLFIFGLFHFVSGADMTGALAGWPFPLFLVYVSGAGLMLGAVAIIINRYARIAAFLLALEIGIFILALHLPGVLQGGEGMQMGIMMLLKDLAIVGGALVIGLCSTNRGFSGK